MGTITIQKSKYKGVSKIRVNGNYEYWRAQYKTRGHNWSKLAKTEREAAVAFDKKMIDIGKEPVNIMIKQIKKGAD